MVSRLIWGIVFVASVTTFVMSLPHFYAQVTTVCEAEPCNAEQIPAEDVRTLAAAGLSLPFLAGYLIVLTTVVAVVFALFALLLVWRRPDDPVVWYFSLVLVVIGFFLSSSVDALVSVSNFWNYFVSIMNALVWLGLASLFYLFPDGRFVPRWTRLALLGWALMTASGFLPEASSWRLGNWSPVATAAVLIALVASCVWAQVYRYRYVSGPVQRQQTKWIVVGFGLIALTILITALLPQAITPQWPRLRVAYGFLRDGIAAISLLSLPVTLSLSILRYRLWDIDILIRRTLIYSVLSVLLTLVYVGSVVLLQTLFRRFSGETSSLAVVASTLTSVALFQPFRHRIQTVIDRRFYRRKYDAEKVLATFALTMRDEVDLDRLSNSLVKVAEETMQPARVLLWLKQASEIPQPVFVTTNRPKENIG